MKNIFINQIVDPSYEGQNVCLQGWVSAKREGKNIIFLDIVDSQGKIQAVIDKENLEISADSFQLAKTVPLESSIEIIGRVIPAKIRTQKNEVLVSSFKIIGLATINLSPSPRESIKSFDIFDERYTNLVMEKRHLYLRNSKLMSSLRFRSDLVAILNNWFRANKFIEFHAPILTQLPLYDDRTAMKIELFGEDLFLTQCVGFYLEAGVHAFERIYNIGPSFRGEESKSKRHLSEYWHVKAEIAFAGLEDVINFTELTFQHVIKEVINSCANELDLFDSGIDPKWGTPPFPRITYNQAINKLNQAGIEIQWGSSISSNDETILAEGFDTPFWIVGNPRSVEPFPYVIDPQDPRLTRTADLIAPNGYGELLGVAEKISNIDDLLIRMKEKNKEGNEKYEWLKELRLYGCVPHAGIGMGLERLIRWLLGLKHVRDAIAFPRLFGRSVSP